jgi:N-methylhydantoinase A
MQRVVIPPFAGVFSALGLLLSPPRTDAARTVDVGADDAGLLRALARQLADTARAEFVSNTGESPRSHSVIADVRYVGQAHETSVPYALGDDWSTLGERFHDAHRRRNGFARRGDPIEVVTLRVEVVGSPALTWDDIPRLTPTGDADRGTRTVHTDAGPMETPVYWRPAITAATTIPGPAIIEEGEATTYVGPGETAVMHDLGALEITW